MKEDMMSKLMGKPSADEGNHKHQAKMDVLNELREMAMGMMGNKVKNHMSPQSDDQMAQVSVTAKDPQDLKKGLDMAREVIPGGDSSPYEAMSSMAEEESQESSDDMDLEEIESLIHELELKRQEKLSQSQS
jgi:hypothetical protein